ncbi:MAG TPA: hypothetical protein VKA31_08725 [Mariprofundaceae bacterium]|nr:hypothetical protein [Mariprofundaceae bacterium]
MNDRILEPNKLPLCGRVWAYSKENTSREMFVGNCISLLSLLGVEDASMSWKDDIMAFDVSYQKKPATVIISLQDDSLASSYFYFLGIWICPESDDPVRVSRNTIVDDIQPGHDEDLLIPALTYAITLWDKPLQMPEMTKMVRSDIFGQRIYQGSFHLCGQTSIDTIPSARFVISPTSPSVQQGRYEIRHALYSLRNLMALMGAVLGVYEKLQQDDSATDLYSRLMVLMGKAEQKGIEAEQWDEMVCELARIAFKGAETTISYARFENEVRSIGRLFDSIVSELDISEMLGVGGLIERMKVPFDHVNDALDEHMRMIDHTEKQTGILQPMMHARMLAGQQMLLKKLFKHNA